MPKSKRICKAKKLDMEALNEDMNKYRDLYQYERVKKFKVSQNCIHKGIKRLVYHIKKPSNIQRQPKKSAYCLKIKLKNINQKIGFYHILMKVSLNSIYQEDMATQKQETGVMVLNNWNAKGRENVIGALVNNSLTACGLVNGNVDFDTLNTWLEKILIP